MLTILRNRVIIQEFVYIGVYLNTSMNYVNKETRKMAKSARKKAAPTSAKKGRRTKKGQVKAAEYVRHLLELHKLQSILLTKLDKEL